MVLSKWRNKAKCYLYDFITDRGYQGEGVLKQRAVGVAEPVRILQQLQALPCASLQWSHKLSK